MIRWGHPFFLYLLFLVPLLALFQVWTGRRSRRQRARFASTSLLGLMAPNLSFARQRFKSFLLLLALLLLLVALADPQVGTRLEEIRREGIDLVIALDVSNSMLAKDIAPSRLEKAKHEVRTLLDLLQGDRVALVAFAGKAVVECPLTLDYGAAEIFLGVMDPGLISRPGTSLGAAIKASLQAFGPESHAGKAILLITDGEDHEEEVDAAVKLAQEKGVIIHAVGIGSPQGVPIPWGEQGGDFKKDQQGSVVVTKLDETALQTIASQTGGIYQRCSTGEDELKEIFAAISGLEKGELSMKKFTQYEHRYQPILFLALLALVLEFVLSDRKMKLPAFLTMFRAEKIAALLLALALPLATSASWRSQVRAGDRAYEKQKYDDALVQYLKALGSQGDSALVHFDLGNVYQALEKFPEAGKALKKSLLSPDSLMRADAYYNLGNALFGEQKYSDAAQSYKAALKLHPDQKDYLHNLELALRLLKKPPPEQQQNQQNQQDQQKQDQQKQQDQQQQDQQQKNEQQQEQQQQQQQKMAAGQLTKEEAERLLNALQQDEKQVQENLRQQQGSEVGVAKDW